MRTVVTIAVVLACCLTARGAEPPPAASLAGLSERLRALAADTTRGYQRLLRDATHEVRHAAEGRLWSEIEPELQKQGLHPTHRESQHLSMHRCLVMAEGWRAGDQGVHALYLEFTVDRRDPAAIDIAKPGSVMVAAAGLSVQPECPYVQVLSRGGYPENSVIARGLRLPEVTAAAQRHPNLAQIELSYDFIRDRWAESMPQGFSLVLAFTDSTHDDRLGEQLHFTVASGLDAPQDVQGRPVAPSFVPQDAFGDFRSWGGSGWRR